MPNVDVVVSSRVSSSARARQLEGMFDVPRKEEQTLTWSGRVPIEDQPWNVGLIVGPSGCGKSTIARHLFADAVDRPLSWGGASVIDDFSPDKSIQEIAEICQAVGFNTIPAWLRPFNVLSNGEQFRVTMARRMLEHSGPIVVDEFTSVVDRQVAQIGSHAIQKQIRKKGMQFVAVSCHYDIVDWLQPDWIFEPATMSFTRRGLRRRPEIAGEIRRVKHAAWGVFSPYHYMTADLHKSAKCFCLFVGGRPAAFAGMLYRPHPKVADIWGLSRLVTLPDFQGLGLAFVLTDYLAAMYKTLGLRFHTYPAHPSLMRSFDRSPNWALVRRPVMSTPTPGKRDGSGLSFGSRPCAVFEWVGPAQQDRALADQLING